MSIDDLKDSIRIRIVNEFFDDVGTSNGYKMLSNFKCERAPALQDFITNEYNGRIKPHIVWDNDRKIVIGYFTLITTCMIDKPY